MTMPLRKLLSILSMTIFFSFIFTSCTSDDDSDTDLLKTGQVLIASNTFLPDTFLSGTLNFSPGQNTPADASYILYFDTDENPSTRYTLSTTSYDYSDLKFNTKYYWKIETVSKNGTVLATSNVFSFTTGLVYEGSLYLDQEQIDQFEYTGVSGDLFIHGFENQTITNLKGLNSLLSVGGNLEIVINKNLESLEGLESIISIGGNLEIDNNSLINFSGLESLETIGGSLIISSNENLASLAGLDALSKIEKGLYIKFNDILTSLVGLDKLNSIGDIVEIKNNKNLISLTGLESLDIIDGALYIGRSTNLNSSGTGNEILQNLCAIRHLIIGGQITTDEYFVGSNLYNPTYEEIQIMGSGGCER